MGHEQINEGNDEAEFEIIREHLANKTFSKNYEIFNKNRNNVVNLLIVRFAEGEDMMVKFNIGHNEIHFPYKNLKQLIKAIYHKDKDPQMPNFEINDQTIFTPFKGMPEENRQLVGKTVLQRINIDKLISSLPDEKKIVVATRLYDEQNTKRTHPFLEIWKAERRTENEYIFGNEPRIELLTSGVNY